MPMRKKEPVHRAELIGLLHRLGFDEAFCLGIAGLMDTDFVTDRMVHYLKNAPEITRETVADEAVAILEDRYKYVQNHINRGW